MALLRRGRHGECKWTMRETTGSISGAWVLSSCDLLSPTALLVQTLRTCLFVTDSIGKTSQSPGGVADKTAEYAEQADTTATTARSIT